MQFEEELRILLLSRHLFIYICTFEEERLEYFIRRIAYKNYPSSVYCWNFIDGYQSNPNCNGKAKTNPLQALDVIESLNSLTAKIFILKDFYLFMDDSSVIRKLKNLYMKLKNSNSHIILSAPVIQISVPLKQIITILNFPLPTLQEITSELKRLFNIVGCDLNIESLAIVYKGMTMEAIRRSVAKLISSKQSVKQVKSIVREEKKQLIQQIDILDLCLVDSNLDDIGGLKNLKMWLQKRAKAFSKQARSYGIPIPRGILLVGVQGTGKSLTAKAIAQQWNIPLLRLDVGKIFGGIIGESELKVRQMIKLAEELEPCVLWIDEIDKSFSRINNNSDSGTTNRVFSSFLTWLSEKKKQVFVVATANNVLNLPSEILRKGRFDEIFFLDLPNKLDRIKIFQIHLMKMRPLTWKQYNIDYLSELTENFSGAEIQQSIIEAMYNAFYERRDFKTEDIVLSVRELIPLAFTDSGMVSRLQQWAKIGKVRLASN